MSMVFPLTQVLSAGEALQFYVHGFPPHPGPLPAGEGIVVLCPCLSLAQVLLQERDCSFMSVVFPLTRVLSLQERIADYAHGFLPLPPGEGWGEGASIKADLICSSTISRCSRIS